MALLAISLTKIMQTTLERIVDAIGDDMRKKKRIATGNTLKSITTSVTTDNDVVRGVVMVPNHFPYVEAGSAPKPRGTWFYRVIHRWAKAKHIISGDTWRSKRISGAIARTIIESGTRAWQMGGEDVFSTDVRHIVEDFEKDVTLDVLQSYRNTFADEIKQFERQ